MKALWLVCLCLFTMPALADKPATAKSAPVELTAEQILKKTFAQSFVGFSQGTATLRMILDDGQGTKKERELSIKIRKGEDGLVKYLIKFTKPADIRGTAFLVHEKKGGVADQYVFVPAAKVVRRVPSGSATASFFGSDLLYADLLPVSQNENQATLKRLPDQKINDQLAYVVEVTPTVEGSPYGRIVLSLDQKLDVPIKVEFFDPAKKALKTMTVKKLGDINGRQVPVQLVMKNVQKGSSTELFVENVNTKAKLSPNDFTEGAMKR